MIKKRTKIVGHISGAVGPKGENGFRAVVQDKCSLAPNGKPFAFELSQENGFKWIGYYDITAEEVLGGMLHKSQKNNAIDFIETILSNGPIASADIFSKAEQQGIAKRSLQGKRQSNCFDVLWRCSCFWRSKGNIKCNFFRVRVSCNTGYYLRYRRSRI